LKKNGLSLAWHYYSGLLLASLALSSCDRGASEEIGAARRFADAVVRNDVPHRDSMIATAKFKEYFDNQYVSSDMRTWFQSFYDLREQRFLGTPSADVD